MIIGGIQIDSIELIDQSNDFSYRNGSLAAAADEGGDVAAAAAKANGEGTSSGGVFEGGCGGGGGVGVGILFSSDAMGSNFSLFDSGPGDTVMLSVVELSSLWIGNQN